MKHPVEIEMEMSSLKTKDALDSPSHIDGRKRKEKPTLSKGTNAGLSWTNPGVEIQYS